MNRKFDRKFCMFKQESDAYTINKKSCQGNSVLEIRSGKGKLSVYMQGLKPLQDATYRVYLVSADQNQAMGVSACLIHVGSSGKGEAKWSFNPDNVENSGKKIEDFNIIALLVKGTGSELIAPMVCYLDKEMIWKKNFVEFQKDSTGENKAFSAKQKTGDTAQQNEMPVVKTENAGFAEEEQKPESGQEYIQEEQNKEENKTLEIKPIEGILEPVTLAQDLEQEPNLNASEIKNNLEQSMAFTGGRSEDVSQTLHNPSLTEENLPDEQESPKEGQDAIYATAKDFFGAFTKPNEEIHENFRNQMRECEEKFDKVLTKADDMKKQYEQIVITYEPETDWDYLYNNNPPMIPFPSQQDINWVRIDYKDMYLLPVDLWVVSNHPFVVGSYNYYKHFILGKNVSDGQMYFGIPDSYQIGYVDRAYEMGFTQFKSCDGSEAEDGSYGYWVMEV